MKPDYKLVAKAKYIHATADLASELWHEVYKRYYPAKQLDTLVEELQSADAIEEDIDNDVNYFLVFLGGKLIGYFAWKMENTAQNDQKIVHIVVDVRFDGVCALQLLHKGVQLLCGIVALVHLVPELAGEVGSGVDIFGFCHKFVIGFHSSPLLSVGSGGPVGAFCPLLYHGLRKIPNKKAAAPLRVQQPCMSFRTS